MAASSKEDIRSLDFLKALFAEFFGTFFLVLVGCGSCSHFQYIPVPGEVIPRLETYPMNVVQVAFCFGLAVATIMWSLAPISGGHINPAVSAAFFFTRKISLLRFLAYVAVQVAGGIAGAFLINFLTPKSLTYTVCSPLLQVGPLKAIIVESLITFILVWTMFTTFDLSRDSMSGSGPLAIGLAVTVCHLWAIPFTGCGMNPARALASHLASTDLKNYIWIYWLGPMHGGITAGLLYDLTIAGNSGLSKLRAFMKRDYDETLYVKEETRGEERISG